MPYLIVDHRNDLARRPTSKMDYEAATPEEAVDEYMQFRFTPIDKIPLKQVTANMWMLSPEISVHLVG